MTACPGSGKTKVIEARAAHLLTANPKAMLCAVSFTREAAEALKLRVSKAVGTATKRTVIGTFHSLCKRQLEGALKRRVTLLSDAQAKQIFRRAYEVTISDSEITFDDALKQVAAWKAMVSPPIPEDEDDRSPEQELYCAFEESLKQMGALEFSDLIRETVRGMHAGTISPIPVQYLLIDEFQDADEVQLAWALAHARAGVQVMCVGDDDQSIYNFRHALGFAGMAQFQKELDAEHVSLGITYRCPREILSPAANLISNNVDRVPKTLKTANKQQGAVHLKAYPSLDTELEGLIETIIADGKFNDWAILARTNNLLDSLEAAIDPKWFPYSRIGGSSFWDLSQPSMYLALLRSFQQHNLVGLDGLLRRCHVSHDTINALHQACNAKAPGSLYRFLDLNLSDIGRSDRGFITTLQARCKHWVSVFNGPSKDFQTAFVGMSLYINEVIKMPTGEKKAELLRSQVSRVTACADRMTRLSGSLAQRISSAQQQGKQKEEGATLMTMHGAKGLEYPNVWLLGCSENIIPASDSPIEEERRIMYVAMTRAKSTLYCSYNTERSQNADAKDALPQMSSFLHEAGIAQVA